MERMPAGVKICAMFPEAAVILFAALRFCFAAPTCDDHVFVYSFSSKGARELLVGE
jgi:hypothetical protein